MSKAREKATRHFLMFIEKNRNSKKIYAKYAEISDEFTSITNMISRKNDLGGEILDEDREDFEYYDEFSKLLAIAIADHALKEAGYRRDERGYWS